MKTIYNNHQDKLDPFNESLVGGNEASELLERTRSKKPHFVCLSSDNGFELLVGIGGDVGCVQHSLSQGRSPNLMAISTHPPMKRGYVEFLTANTLTPVAARYIINADELKQVVLHFVRTGERSDAVIWQKLNLRALQEDAERQVD
jgi:hypothetical protein